MYSSSFTWKPKRLHGGLFTPFGLQGARSGFLQLLCLLLDNQLINGTHILHMYMTFDLRYKELILNH